MSSVARAMAGESGAGLSHPGLERGGQWGNLSLANGRALRRGQAVDATLGCEDGVYAAHRLTARDA